MPMMKKGITITHPSHPPLRSQVAIVTRPIVTMVIVAIGQVASLPPVAHYHPSPIILLPCSPSCLPFSRITAMATAMAILPPVVRAGGEMLIQHRLMQPQQVTWLQVSRAKTVSSPDKLAISPLALAEGRQDQCPFPPRALPSPPGSDGAGRWPSSLAPSSAPSSLCTPSPFS